MAKDYAKMYTERNHRKEKLRPRYFLIGLICVFLGVGLAVLFHALHLGGGSSKVLGPQFNLGSINESTAKGASYSAKLSEKKPVKFSFYKKLSNDDFETSQYAVPDEIDKSYKQKVKIAHLGKAKSTLLPLSSAAKPLKVHPAASYYVLQLGVFSARSAASRVRLNYLLSGVDSLIIKEKNSAGRLRFRIQQGSYSSKRAAVIAKKRLHKKGIDALVRKVVDKDATNPT